jgi:hypothetical protein
MAARNSSQDPKLAAIVRARQDAVAEAEKLESQLIFSISGAPELRDEVAERKTRERLGTIDKEVSGIDVRLSTEFPQFFGFVSPDSISLENTQEILRENEVLIKFQLTASDAFAWLVTRKAAKWVKLSSSAGALATAAFCRS